MQNWQHYLKTQSTKRLLAAVLAVGAVGTIATFNLTKTARAATPAPAASALDDNSVGALLNLDQAMETLAARVTPAVVNVTVASKSNGQQQAEGNSNSNNEDQGGPDMQQFFGPNGPFGDQGNQSGRQFGRQFRIIPNQPENRMEHGLGSGVIISPDGYIVTNNHVIEGAVDIRVTMSNREVLSAKLVGADPLTDLAVIKVDGHNLPSVPWGNSANLRPGQTVLAFGNPYGYRFTVTRGIVSALNRPNPDPSDRRKPGEFIQTDAAINPGNSGGALVDARGELIGINTFLISSSGSFSGMGFAIPTQMVQPIVDTLIRDGKVTHAFIGVQISDVTPDNAKFFHMNKAEGALISEVQPDAPGAKAGLRTGDVITEINGKPVNDAGQLQMIVAQKRPGDTLQLQVMRDSKTENIPVTLETQGGPKGSEVAGSEHGKGRWGLSLAELTPDVRNELQLRQSIHGAVVEEVQPGSPADNAGLQRGDVIMEVNRQSAQTASDAAKALTSVPKGQDALVLVWSQGGSTFRVLHPSQG
jgi:serine protease Do